MKLKIYLSNGSDLTTPDLADDVAEQIIAAVEHDGRKWITLNNNDESGGDNQFKFCNRHVVIYETIQ